MAWIGYATARTVVAKTGPVQAWLLCAVLAACTAAPETQTAGITPPELWSRLTERTENAPLVSTEDAHIEQAWWQQFHDPNLDGLIEEALRNNLSLAIAKARVEEAQASRTGARAALLPQLDATSTAIRGNQGYYTQGGVATIADTNLQASWELDVFGKNQARASAAQAILQSQQATQQAVTVALLAEVARTYFDLRNNERQIAITRQNLDLQQQTLALTKAQLQGALASDFDVQRASAQVASTAAQLPLWQAAYDASLNRLNVLLGAAPGEKDGLIEPATALAPIEAGIVVAAPATVIAERPDIRAAERRFAGSVAQHTAATREIFPTISLLGLFGAEQTSGIDTSPTWGLSAGLALPLLNFGRIQADIDAADARQQQAFLAYRQTVLEALEDMENALSNYGHETLRNQSLRAAAMQYRRAADVLRQQYRSGEAGLLDLLVVERQALDAEAALAQSDSALRIGLVHVYAAAGGGWQTDRTLGADL